MQVTRNIYYFASTYFFLIAIVATNVDAQQEKNIKAQQEKNNIPLLFSIERDLGNPFYVEQVLPCNLSYIQQLLMQGNMTDQDCPYVQSILRLFSNLFKRTPCINAYSFGILVEQLPDLLKKHVGLKKSDAILRKTCLGELDMYNRFQAAVNEMLFNSLSSRFHEFKQEPAQFLNSMSRTIMELAQEEIALEQLRSSLVRFLEIGIGKLMWDPTDYYATWNHVIALSKDLATLLKSNLLDDLCDLDDLYWSLVQRYTYFLKINATEIPLTFYEKIEKDLDSRLIPLLSLDEQESFIENKKAYFVRVVIDCKAKSVAYTHGILT